MPSFGPISSAPVSGGARSSAGSATAFPAGIFASAAIGIAVATGGAPGSAIALPLGVTAYARVGQISSAPDARYFAAATIIRSGDVFAVTIT